jgi:hypothetical protein
MMRAVVFVPVRISLMTRFIGVVEGWRHALGKMTEKEIQEFSNRFNDFMIGL